MRKKTLLTLLVAVVGVLALMAAGCGGDEEEAATPPAETGAAPAEPAPAEPTPPAAELPPVEALPSTSCGDVEFGGAGEPQVLIVSDLPMQGPDLVQTEQMVNGIRFVLDERGWKAGDLNVAYQVCDDATAQAAKWDPGKCSQNANSYAANASLVAVIGTFNSGCAQIEIPVLNQAPGGAVAMVSPANTLVCLTEASPACEDTEPDKYYPSGVRNYARVAAHDRYQGAVMAQWAKDHGVTKVYVLNDTEAYGIGVATNFRNAAEFAGIEIAGFEKWEKAASSYEALMQKIKGTGANGVFLGGVLPNNGGQLIRDKVAVLGPNTADGGEGVVLLAPDGFTTQAIVEPDEGGAVEAEGAYLSVVGARLEDLGPAGQEFIAAFEEKYAAELKGNPPDPYSAYGAQAAQIVLDAIETGGADRAGVIQAIFDYSVEDGLIGSFEINDNGDPTPAEGAVVGFLIYRASKTSFAAEVTALSPTPELVEAAGGS